MRRWQYDGVSKFVECWTFRRTARKKPKSKAFGMVWTRRICRTVSKVGFFDECRKKNQKKRYFLHIFLAFFGDMPILSNFRTKSTDSTAAAGIEMKKNWTFSREYLKKPIFRHILQ